MAHCTVTCAAHCTITCSVHFTKSHVVHTVQSHVLHTLQSHMCCTLYMYCTPYKVTCAAHCTITCTACTLYSHMCCTLYNHMYCTLYSHMYCTLYKVTCAAHCTHVLHTLQSHMCCTLYSHSRVALMQLCATRKLQFLHCAFTVDVKHATSLLKTTYLDWWFMDFFRYFRCVDTKDAPSLFKTTYLDWGFMDFFGVLHVCWYKRCSKFVQDNLSGLWIYGLFSVLPPSGVLIQKMPQVCSRQPIWIEHLKICACFLTSSWRVQNMWHISLCYTKVQRADKRVFVSSAKWLFCDFKWLMDMPMCLQLMGLTLYWKSALKQSLSCLNYVNWQS